MTDLHGHTTSLVFAPITSSSEELQRVARGEKEWAVVEGDCRLLAPNLPRHSVDLIYADVPYNSGRTFGDDYSDKWEWTSEHAERLSESTHTWYVIMGAYHAHGPAMAAYLLEIGSMLAEDETLSSPIPCLKPSGALWVQCDTVAASYLRMLLDSIMGASRWRNSVVWRYRRWPTKSNRLQRMHDVLHFYAGDGAFWDPLHGIEELAESTKKTFGAKKQRALFQDGKRVRSTVEPELSAGPPLSDVWDTGEWALGELPNAMWELPILAPQAKEREDGGRYSTQKPKALLERVIGCSGARGGLLLDICCGSGTSLVAGREMGMRVVGFDKNPRAVEISRTRVSLIR